MSSGSNNNTRRAALANDPLPPAGQPGFHPGDTRHSFKYARNWGSAKSGVRHWWIQRVTAAALIVLGLWFLIMVLTMLGSDYGSARALLAKPLNGVLMIAFVATAFWHAQLGLQVVVEDYIHVRWVAVVLMVVFKMLAVLLSLISAMAVLKIVLGG